MPAPRRVTDAQILKLIEYLEQHKDIKLGTAAPEDKQIEHEHWLKITELLNSLPGETRDVAKWRSYWNDLKWRCRRKIAEGTNLASFENRILNLAGRVSNYSGTVSVIPRGCEKAEPEPNRVNVKIDRDSDDEMEWNMDNSNLPDNQDHDYPAKDPLPMPVLTVRFGKVENSPSSRDEEQGEDENTEQDAAGEVVPEWVRRVEQRRLGLEERTTRAIEQMSSGMASMAAAMQNIAASLRSIEESMRDLKNKH